MTTSKKLNAVHPLNVFTIPLSGPGFQQVIRKQPQSLSYDNGLDRHDEAFQGDDDVLFHRNIIPRYAPCTSKNRRGIPADCPKGLESLMDLEHLFVKQSHLITEFFLNVANKYEILNSNGEFVFLGAETTPPLTRIFCFGGHPFEISINTLPGRGQYSWNSKGSEVLKLSGSPGSCGCGSEVTVTHARKPLGSIEQEGDCTRPLYTIRDKGDKEILQIQGPSKPHCFSCGFSSTNTNNLKFDVYSGDGKQSIARIAKQWADPVENRSQSNGVPRERGGVNPRVEINGRESLSVAARRKSECEMWGIRFPTGADLETKGLLLSAVFLFEYQYASLG